VQWSLSFNRHGVERASVKIASLEQISTVLATKWITSGRNALATRDRTTDCDRCPGNSQPTKVRIAHPRNWISWEAITEFAGWESKLSLKWANRL